MFRPAVRWPVIGSAIRISTKGLSHVFLTACTVSCDGEVRSLKPKRLAILCQPLEGVVTLFVLDGKLDFWRKSVLRKDDWEPGPECKIPDYAVVFVDAARVNQVRTNSTDLYGSLTFQQTIHHRE